MIKHEIFFVPSNRIIENVINPRGKDSCKEFNELVHENLSTILVSRDIYIQHVFY